MSERTPVPQGQPASPAPEPAPAPPLPAQGGVRRQIPLGLHAKMLILFTPLFFIVFAAAFYWFFQFATALAEDNLRRELTSIAELVAAGVDGDAHTALYESDLDPGRPLEDPRYRDIVTWLATAKVLSGTELAGEGQEVPRLTLYTYAAGDSPGTVIFTGSSSALNDPPSGAEFRETYQPQSTAMLLGLQETAVNLEAPITDRWGRWVSAFTPIRDQEGEIVGALGVDMRETTVAALQQRLRNTMLVAFLLTYGALFVAIWLLSERISRPVVALTRSADQVAAGNYDLSLARPEDRARFPDETYTLAAVFEVMVSKVAQREQQLKEQVHRLRIRIDHKQEERQVAEITESDFFQSLEAKVAELRQIAGGSKS